MAKRTIEVFHDDLDGSEGASTVKFGLDGKSYEIDLSEGHEKELRKALEKEPTFIEARFALAKALLARGDLSAARSEFETVIKQAPGHVDAVNGLGLTFLRQGQTSQAIVQFDQALELKPDFAEAAENLRVARASESRFQSRQKP